MARGHYQDAEEGKRGVALSLTNAVFSKLIKMGRELGKTPQRMAQELFDEAYAARCMGKVKLASQVAIADEPAELQRLYDQANGRAVDLQAKLDKSEAERAELWRKNRELDGDRDAAKATIAELREAAKGQLVVVSVAEEERKRAWELVEAERKTIASLKAAIGRKDAEISELTVTVEELRKKCLAPAEPEQPAWAQPPSAAQFRAIKAMAAARNSPAAIARQLGVSVEQVKQALA